MSHQTAAPARVAEAFHPTTGRTWEDRFALRLPALYRAVLSLTARLFERLPVGSPVRMALLRRTAARSYGAWNRGDADLLVAMYHPDCTWDDRHWLSAIEPTVYSGHAGLRKAVDIWWEDWSEFYSTGSDLQDRGDRFVIAGHFFARGRQSGAPVAMDYTQVSTQRDGLIHFVANFTEADQAAAALARPSLP